MNRNNDVVRILGQHGISIDSQMEKRIEKKLKEELTYKARIAIFGKTGAGKSSLINALFGSNIAQTDAVTACTRIQQEVNINVGQSSLTLIDCPGVGESSDRDQEYHQLYNQLLSGSDGKGGIDLALWLIKGDDRALTIDERFYKSVIIPYVQGSSLPFIFVIVQSEKIEPMDEWNNQLKEPGVNQYRNIDRKRQVVSQYFNVPYSHTIAVSSHKKYKLMELIDEIVMRLPSHKAKLTTAQQVAPDLISNHANKQLNSSWINVIDEILKDVVPAYKQIRQTAQLIYKPLKSAWNAIKSWF